MYASELTIETTLIYMINSIIKDDISTALLNELYNSVTKHD